MLPKPPGAPIPRTSALVANDDEVDKYDYERSGELTSNESGYILDQCLKGKHRKDPTILAFIDSFIRCKNIAQASNEVGIAPRVGYLIRHRLDISNCIQKLIDKSAVKYGFDASEIMERTKEIVDFDPIQMQNPDGTFKSNLHDIEPAARRSLKKLKVKNLWGDYEDMNGIKKRIIVGEVIEYEFYDKLKAAEMVGKEKEMFKNTTKVEHSVTKDMSRILLASAERGRDKALNFKDMRVVEAEVVEDDGEE